MRFFWMLWLGSCRLSGDAAPHASTTVPEAAPSTEEEEAVAPPDVGPAPGETLVLDRGRRFEGATRVLDVADPTLETRVLDATFSKYLKTGCPPIPGASHAGTWTELDRLQEAAIAQGIFRPRVAQRVLGHFTAPDVDETLLVIDRGECVANGWGAVIVVVVATAALERTPGRLELRARVEDGAWGGHRHLVGVVTHGGIDVLIWSSGELARFSRMDGGAALRLEKSLSLVGRTLTTCPVVLTAPASSLQVRELPCRR